MANYDKIKIVKTEIIESKKTGNKFRVYKTTDPENGKIIDLRFTREVKNAPEERCYIIVPEGGSNIDRSKEYPICWVKEVSRVVPFASEKKDTGFEKVSEEDLEDIPF